MRFLHLFGRGNDMTERVDVLLHPDVADAAAEAICEAWHRAASSWDLLVLGAVPADGAFLCSVHAGYIAGQNVLADGGAYPGTF